MSGRTGPPAYDHEVVAIALGRLDRNLRSLTAGDIESVDPRGFGVTLASGDLVEVWPGDIAAAKRFEPDDHQVDAAVRAFNGWPADHPIDELHRQDTRWAAMRLALQASRVGVHEKTPLGEIERMYASVSKQALGAAEDYRVLEEHIFEAFNPPDDSTDPFNVVDDARGFIESVSCACTPESVEAVGACGRCAVLGRVADEPVGR